MSDVIDLDTAIAQLPEGDEIHTFRNPMGMLVGADWERADVLKALHQAKEIHVTGELAQAMHHGIAIMHDDSMLFIATVSPTDD